MRSDAVHSDIFDMLMEYVCENENLGFCNNCPELRYVDDIGTYDCPYGLSADSCEYTPYQELDTFANKFVSVMADVMP